MSHLATLGHTPNPLIEQYQSAFVIKLHSLWQTHFPEPLPPDEFLLFPDNHGLLLASVRPQISGGALYREKLFERYKAFFQNGTIQDPRETIPGTDITLTLDFENPDVDRHTHPDHRSHGVGVGFGSIDPTVWRELFAESFAIVQKVSPSFMSEIDRMIYKIIPFGVSYQVHNSGSYSDIIGHLLMSYPTGMDHPELALLEAILHEYNHNKLNLIMQTETLILNDRRETYYSPYRPDVRHIHGIYLGLHAIAGAYWVIWDAHCRGIITLPEAWQEKAVLYVLKNGLSLQVLDRYARLSPLGQEILEEMRAVHMECLRAIQKSGTTPEVIARAKGSLKRHYQDVRANYPGLLS